MRNKQTNKQKQVEISFIWSFDLLIYWEREFKRMNKQDEKRDW